MAMNYENKEDPIVLMKIFHCEPLSIFVQD